jgi:hypothetical protein
MDKYNLHATFEINKHTDPIEEANKRYAEKLKVNRTKPVYDSRRFELFSEMDSQPDLALKACGLDFIKRICSIDQELAHNILSILSQAVEKDNFDDVEMNFRKLVYKKLAEEEKNNYRRR